MVYPSVQVSVKEQNGLGDAASLRPRKTRLPGKQHPCVS
ncbi:hypothetical protein BN2497_13781 [Janthinobacterium sp. CG23_2]|nr:hypothetical protein BN2497_13781 [Janthinobacterium sp. CG23_2]CUU33288.1 hypothetical protein BN3177_13781 [Janthinobacterium sp. CG23_2]